MPAFHCVGNIMVNYAYNVPIVRCVRRQWHVLGRIALSIVNFAMATAAVRGETMHTLLYKQNAYT